MRIAALTLLLTLAFLVLASNADTKPSCTVKFLKKFGGYLIGGCQEDCHRILTCPEDKDCDLEADIVGKRCRCTMCIYSSKGRMKESAILSS
ncbi:hypothetical protein ZWY2020_031695 [Hordeum vulgare]|nr:hypothetical protein ZWY2020_031695 [Hordeum vulgare]